jgi:hypothetical protein
VVAPGGQARAFAPGEAVGPDVPAAAWASGPVDLARRTWADGGPAEVEAPRYVGLEVGGRYGWARVAADGGARVVHDHAVADAPGTAVRVGG